VVVSARPQASASGGRSRPAGSGRFRVRSIRESVRRSSSMLKQLAPAATSAVPARVAASRPVRMPPVEPRAKPTKAVSTTISVMRGLVSSM